MKLTRSLILTLSVICAVSCRYVSSQVSVSPTAIYVDDRLNVGSLLISNSPDAAREVSVSFKFGYPSADSTGNLFMVYDDKLKESRYGIGPGVRAFPRKFRLQPGGQQTVRVQILNMGDKPDGVYWERMIITSRESVPDIEELSISKGIGAKINYTFKQNIALFYLKGETCTGIVPKGVTASVEDGTLAVISRLIPEGNSPFNGSVNLDISDESGKLVVSHRQTIAVYFESLYRMDIMLPENCLPAGRYSFEFTYQTERGDIPAADLVQAEPVRYVVYVDISSVD